MSDEGAAETSWRRSTRSNTGTCVEVRFSEGSVHVRNSRHRDGPVLTFTFAEWESFLAGARAGEFDRPHVTADGPQAAEADRS
jgi:Domain of unknown function (DUF397)